MLATVTEWLDARLQVRQFLAFLAKKTVPTHHHSIWYYFGGVTLLLFILQVITGILLLLYYRPTQDAAFESVQFIITHVPFGWLIRSIHSWAANLMILAAFIHLFSVYFMKGYRPPRELTWVSGFVLLSLSLGFGFSGYLLPWNELSFFATQVGTDIVRAVPFIGHQVMVFLRGGEEISGATLTRFFGFHVALLPLLTTVLLLIHLGLVQQHGVSKPLSYPKRRENYIPFYPHFALREAMVWLGVLALLIGLATYFPWDLGRKTDPYASAPMGIRPEWYFTFMSQTLKYLPATIWRFEGEQVGILAFGVGGLFLLLIPFLDWQAKQGQPSRLWTFIGVGIVAYMIVMITLAYIKPY
jgi:cytochrome b6